MKIVIDWEDIDIKEILQHPQMDEFDEEPMSVGEMLINKYLEQDHHFHILNTNFNLNGYLCRRIANVAGVERFTPLSRYKAMVNIAKLFEVDVVKRGIKSEINKYFYNKRLARKQEEKPEEGV